MLHKLAAALSVTFLACAEPVLAFRSPRAAAGQPPRQRPSRAGRSPQQRRVAVVVAAEPIPVGTVVGLARNVNRAAKAYPSALDSAADGPPVDRLAALGEYKARLAAEQAAAHDWASVVGVVGPADVVAAALFGVVLWFGVLNDLLFPKAMRPADLLLPWVCRNLLGLEGAWLDDFARGSRGEYPTWVKGGGAALFGAGGLVLEQTVKVLYGGGASNDGALFACQLGLVGCLWAGVYELGRRDVGVALRSRAEDDARDQVWAEFQVFAEQYLERCSEATSVNQVEVLRVFRRTHSRHRRPDQPGAASDGLLNEALVFWHQGPSGFGALAPEAAGGAAAPTPRTPPPPSPAGFFKGIRLKSTYTGF